MITPKSKPKELDYSKKKNYPKHRITLFLMLFYESFWRIIGANLLFVLFSIPIVTIPAAWAGLTRVMSRFARDEHAFVFDDFLETFKKEFWRSLILGAITLAGGVLAYIAVSVYSRMLDDEVLAVGLTALVIVITLAFILIMGYAFVMLVSVELPLKSILKNALALCIVKPFGSLMTLVVTFGVYFVAVYFFPAGLILPIFFGFSLISFVTGFNAWPQIKKYVIEPFDKKKEG